MVAKSFVRYSSIHWILWFLIICSISVQAPLIFRLSTEKLGLIPKGLPLYVTWSFSLEVINILPFFSYCVGRVLSFMIQSIYYSLSFCTFTDIFNLGKFSSMTFLKIFSGPFSSVSSFSCISIVLWFVLFIVPHISWMFHVRNFLDIYFL